MGIAIDRSFVSDENGRKGTSTDAEPPGRAVEHAKALRGEFELVETSRFEAAQDRLEARESYDARDCRPHHGNGNHRPPAVRSFSSN